MPKADGKFLYCQPPHQEGRPNRFMRTKDPLPGFPPEAATNRLPGLRVTLVDFHHLIDQTLLEEQLSETSSAKQDHRIVRIKHPHLFHEGDAEEQVSGKGGLNDELPSHLSIVSKISCGSTRS